MLKANGQPQDIPLWITEICAQAPVRRDDASDEAQAVAFAKAYLLSIAAGFSHVLWFEARGPSITRSLGETADGRCDHLTSNVRSCPRLVTEPRSVLPVKPQVTRC
jgi:hypothetical protein